jgi:hypothetical protein
LAAGLESHPDFDIAADQMTGFGGVISFEIDGDLWRTAKFVDSVCTRGSPARDHSPRLYFVCLPCAMPIKDPAKGHMQPFMMVSR